MAKYIITHESNGLVGLAETDAHKTAWLNISDSYRSLEITDDQFLNLKTDSTSVSSIDGNNVSFNDEGTSTNSTWTEEMITNDVNHIKERLTNFINGYQDSQLKTDAENYLNYLNDTFNVSNITFPSNQNIHKYFNSNNITFLHPLQIP